MRQHRGYSNRAQWTRKTKLPEEGAELSPLSRNSPPGNAQKDDSWNCWTETDQVESSDACWDAKVFDSTFLEENRKVFEWDNSGAVEGLKKAEAQLLRGGVAGDEHDGEQYLAPIDWDTRWLCNLPYCAESSPVEKRKKSASGNVIIGLPEAREHNPRSATPSLKVPVDFVPVPTGWGEPVETAKTFGWEDPYIESATLAAGFGADKADRPGSGSEKADLPAPDSCQPSVAAAADSELPEHLTSYQHIVPSGWGDAQDNSPLVPSGWDQEPRADVQMHQADNGWGNLPSRRADIGSSGWDNVWPSVEPGGAYGNANPGKRQDFYQSYEDEYRKPKRGSDLNYGSSKNVQRHARPNSAVHRVNHDLRLPRVNRWERSSKSQWQAVHSLAHENQASLRRNPGGLLATTIDV